MNRKPIGFMPVGIPPFERLKSFVSILAAANGHVTSREEIAEFEKEENVSFTEEQIREILACNPQN